MNARDRNTIEQSFCERRPEGIPVRLDEANSIRALQAILQPLDGAAVSGMAAPHHDTDGRLAGLNVRLAHNGQTSAHSLVLLDDGTWHVRACVQPDRAHQAAHLLPVAGEAKQGLAA